MARPTRPIDYVASARKELLSFPESAQVDALFQIGLLHEGDDPDDFGPMPEVGKDAMEIRIRDGKEAFRVFYVARFEDVIYVLHCFHKKSKRGKATPKPNIVTAQARYKQMLAKRRSNS